MHARWIERASWVALGLASGLLMTTGADAAATRPVVGAVRPADPALLTPAARDSLTHAIEKERADTEQWLREKPTSYLATVQRTDFDDRGTLTVGRSPRCDVRIEDDTVEPQHLRVTVVGDSFHVVAADTSARFVVGGVPRSDATLGPGSIEVGRFTVRLSHQRYPAIIVFDPRSPRFQEYKGLAYFPVDLSYRYVLPLTANPKPDTVVILSTRGNQRRVERIGWFDFRVRGTPCRLEVSRLLEPGVGEGDLAVFFRDATSGKQTYGIGRYLNVEHLADGRYVLDFNSAYNPACAFSVHYNCPIPPRANTLKVAIRAGEKDSHYSAH